MSPIITAHSNKSQTKKNEVSTNVLENFKLSGSLLEKNTIFSKIFFFYFRDHSILKQVKE